MSAPIGSRIAFISHTRWTRVALLILALVARESRAQDSSSAPSSRWMVGGSVGMLRYGGEFAPLQYSTIGMHFTQVRPGALGADFSIGIIPRVLAEGFLLAGARGGVALPFALAPNVLLLPSAGLTLIGGLGAGGGGGTWGSNLGAAAVFGSGSVGFRTGVTWHRLSGGGDGIWLLEFGVAKIPRRG